MSEPNPVNPQRKVNLDRDGVLVYLGDLFEVVHPETGTVLDRGIVTQAPRDGRCGVRLAGRNQDGAVRTREIVVVP